MFTGWVRATFWSFMPSMALHSGQSRDGSGGLDASGMAELLFTPITTAGAIPGWSGAFCWVFFEQPGCSRCTGSQYCSTTPQLLARRHRLESLLDIVEHEQR